MSWAAATAASGGLWVRLWRVTANITAAAAHLPLVNLLVPAFTALVFVHLGLAGLRRLRLEQGIQL